MRAPTHTVVRPRPLTGLAVLTLALSLGLGMLSLAPATARPAGAPAPTSPVSSDDERPLGWFLETDFPSGLPDILPPSPGGGRGDEAEQTDPRSEDFPALPTRCATRAEQVPKTPMKCVLRKAGKNKPTLVVWGDSHMFMMLPAVREAIKGRKVGLVAFIFGGCVPARPDMEIWAGQPCSETADMANRYLAQMQKRGKKVRVILGSFWGFNLNRVYYYPTPELEESSRTRRPYTMSYTRELFRWLGKKKIKTDVLVQGPIAVPPNPDCRPGPTPYECDIVRYHALYKERYITNWLKRQVRHLPRGARLINYNDRLCSQRTCKAVQPGGVQTWYDGYHVSATAAKRYAGMFKPSVKRLLRSR